MSWNDPCAECDKPRYDCDCLTKKPEQVVNNFMVFASRTVVEEPHIKDEYVVHVPDSVEQEAITSLMNQLQARTPGIDPRDVTMTYVPARIIVKTLTKKNEEIPTQPSVH